MRIRGAVIAAALLLGTSGLRAETAAEIGKRYDPKGTGLVQGRMLIVYRLHQADPILKKYDLDNSGALEPREYAALTADIARKYRPKPGSKHEPAPSIKIEQFEQAQAEVLSREKLGLPIERLADPPKPVADDCNPTQNLYIRRDRLDNNMYGITALSAAKGASLSFSDDNVAKQRTGVIDGAITYVLARSPCRERPEGLGRFDPFTSAYAIAAWTEGHGNIRTARRGEASDVRAGFDLQAEVASGLFNLQTFAISPYYQTDFRGEARGYGITGSWEPYLYNINLGATLIRPSELLSWYWQAKAELDYKQIDEVGQTNLVRGHYAWAGGTLRLHAFPFPAGSPVLSEIAGRVHLSTTFQWYYDFYNQRAVRNFTSEAAYNLDSSGSTSISVAYSYGTDKNTFAKSNAYTVKLNYKY